MLVEKEARTMRYGQSSFTVFIDWKGRPLIPSLKVTRAKRTKYGK